MLNSNTSVSHRANTPCQRPGHRNVTQCPGLPAFIAALGNQSRQVACGLRLRVAICSHQGFLSDMYKLDETELKQAVKPHASMCAGDAACPALQNDQIRERPHPRHRHKLTASCPYQPGIHPQNSWTTLHVCMFAGLAGSHHGWTVTKSRVLRSDGHLIN